MSMPTKVVQYTIRGISPELDKRLRQLSARRKQSLNQVVVDELTCAVMGHERHTDFSDLVGQWTPEPAFDEIMATQRQVDLDNWR